MNIPGQISHALGTAIALLSAALVEDGYEGDDARVTETDVDLFTWTQPVYDPNVVRAGRRDGDVVDKRIVVVMHPRCDEYRHAFVFLDGLLIRHVTSPGGLFYAAVRGEWLPLDIPDTSKGAIEEQVELAGRHVTVCAADLLAVMADLKSTDAQRAKALADVAHAVDHHRDLGSYGFATWEGAE